MSVVLSEHLPLLATAPDGIQNLRGLILELAVRGKLVPQDPNEEPASELLKRIAQERAQLEAEGKIRKSKPLSRVDESEQPYTLPENWSWSRLGQSVIESGAGWSPSCESRPRANDEWGVLKVSSVSWGTFNPAENKALPGNLEPRSEHEVVAGDFLISRANTAELVARSVVVEDCPPHLMLSDKIVRLKLSKSVSGQFVNLANSCFRARNYYAAVAGGTSASMKNVSREQILNLAMPLPPLAEQHRIVAKVDELMALWDRLEAEQTDAEAAHAKLVDTLLDTLTQSTDAAELAANWQRLAKHFDTLFTTESSLDALKQTILQLAVMGKLVPQDPNEEPASELLKRIAQERARLEAEGICKKSRATPLVDEDEQPFALPNSWKWIRLAHLDPEFQNGESSRGAASGSETVVLRLADILKGAISLSDTRSMVLPESSVQKYQLQRNDLLVIRVNGSAEIVGRLILCAENLDAIYCDHFIRVRINDTSIAHRFLRLIGDAPVIRGQVQSLFITTAGQKTVNQGHIGGLIIPLPPLAEQHRIVAKVDELMAIYERLKSDLAESCPRQARLSATLIESALKAA